MVDFFKNYGFLISIISLIFFVVGSLGTYYWLLQLPYDYFKNVHRSESVIKKLFRNVLGFTLIILGILMLFLPGQGLITLFLGIFTCDTKLTRSLRYKLMGSRKIQSGLNSIRAKHNKKDFSF